MIQTVMNSPNSGDIDKAAWFQPNNLEPVHLPPMNGTNELAELQDSDRGEVQAARDGDPLAAKRLYLKHHRRVTNLARLMLGNAADAEDICHETFLRALTGLNGFRGETTFAAWLSRIAINQCKNWRSRRRTRHLFVVREGQKQAESPFPMAKRSSLELQLALEQASHQLSEGQREVWICHDVLGMNHDEIGYVFECASGTSKAQLHKARLKLRELLSEGKENDVR